MGRPLPAECCGSRHGKHGDRERGGRRYGYVGGLQAVPFLATGRDRRRGARRGQSFPRERVRVKAGRR